MLQSLAILRSLYKITLPIFAGNWTCAIASSCYVDLLAAKLVGVIVLDIVAQAKISVMKHHRRHPNCKVLAKPWTSALLISVSLLLAAMPNVRAQSPEEPQFTLQADVQETDDDANLVTARGNVLFRYPHYEIEATAEEAQYFVETSRLVLVGDVYLEQAGEVLKDTHVVCLLAIGQCMPLAREILM